MPDRFSVQQGIVAPPSLGLKEASEELRTAFYNWCALTFLIRDDGRWYSRCQVLWNFMHRPLDEMPLTPYDTQRHLKLYLIREAHWWQFYDFVQFIPYVLSSENFARRQTRAELNDLLANEGSAYRFVEDSLAPVVAPVEAEEVEKALHSPVAAVGVQIADALAKLSARPHPDVRNSIKESISAVESALKIATGSHSGDLNAALKKFEKDFGDMHPQFRAALSNLYNFTSDEKGIRHGLLDPNANVDIYDGRFMLIVCSAFANFVVARATARPAN